ncbi:hypothetical protein J0895_25020 [Phormidium pseudopriestleyi FRX01]|uniref:Uncharacterized protein n=1 Tax=Phormidium pseudopriestleyi FRX01 TaxID=1759528 RepID=A0ABS3FYT1_9CYAN|nr:hypothetical protein [Phormidium pseudopriestleyi]MBO0352285.1 hypothetical protein [Phormidium pseudopriestleyi FRX01]
MGLWEGYNERITGLYFICSTGADTPHQIAKLAQALETPNCRIITPNLGWLRTFWRIEPLIQTVETLVAENRATYPTTPMRIIGHSMGD